MQRSTGVARYDEIDRSFRATVRMSYEELARASKPTFRHDVSRMSQFGIQSIIPPQHDIQSTTHPLSDTRQGSHDNTVRQSREVETQLFGKTIHQRFIR
jgi:hypothetical protein